MSEPALSHASVLARPAASSRRRCLDQTQLIIGHLIQVDGRAPPFLSVLDGHPSLGFRPTAPCVRKLRGVTIGHRVMAVI